MMPMNHVSRPTMLLTVAKFTEGEARGRKTANEVWPLTGLHLSKRERERERAKDRSSRLKRQCLYHVTALQTNDKCCYKKLQLEGGKVETFTMQKFGVERG